MAQDAFVEHHGETWLRGEAFGLHRPPTMQHSIDIISGRPDNVWARVQRRKPEIEGQPQLQAQLQRWTLEEISRVEANGALSSIVALQAALTRRRFDLAFAGAPTGELQQIVELEARLHAARQSTVDDIELRREYRDLLVDVDARQHGALLSDEDVRAALGAMMDASAADVVPHAPMP